MTERLYYHDSYLREFTARLIQIEGDTVYLDRTAFYPSSGGQPFDTGSMAGVPVTDVLDEGERIAHRVAVPLPIGEVRCAVDWQRRFDHMQQHTGQHLLSAVFQELLGLRTISFHLGQQSSTIDLEASAIDAQSICEVERRANEAVFENRPVTVAFQDAAETAGLRKPSERQGTLRIVTIEGLDRNACGGTHVRHTGEIGPILIRKLEKIRQSVRVEFLCGARAVNRARADYQALARIAQFLSAPLDEAPALVSAALEAARAVDKLQRKLATYQGKELYETTTPDQDGIRRHVHRAPAGSADELSALARSFTSQPRAIYLAAVGTAVIFAVSEDIGLDAGSALKEALALIGGRGGGNACFGQGSVPDPASLDSVLKSLEAVRPQR